MTKEPKMRLLEINLTCEDINLIESTTIGMQFISNCAIISQTDLLDYRLIKMNELTLNVCDNDKAILKNEISCVDLLLTIRNYIEENKPNSLILIENSMHNKSIKDQF
jgi:hypothetical protein